MRLSTDDSRDEELGLETIAAAAEAGVTVFDTARAYGRGEAELGHNERLLVRALRRCGAYGRARWRTSVRALARLVDEVLVRRIGIANVNRRQLDEALELAPVAAVQVALSPYEDRSLRGGVVERCTELGISLIARVRREAT